MTGVLLVTGHGTKYRFYCIVGAGIIPAGALESMGIAMNGQDIPLQSYAHVLDRTS